MFLGQTFIRQIILQVKQAENVNLIQTFNFANLLLLIDQIKRLSLLSWPY